MKGVATFSFLYLLGMSGMIPMLGQIRPQNRAHDNSTGAELRSQTLSFHNPYTSATVNAQLMSPASNRSAATAILLTGGSEREQRAATAMAAYLTRRGIAILRMPALPANGASEEDNLNTLAALNHLHTLSQFRSTPIGLIGYGEGVRLAPVTASQTESTAFLIAMGGAIVPDRLNSLPDKLTHGTLPRDAASQALSHVRCPVLIMLGEYDGQGTHRAAAENNNAVRAALDAGRHNNYTISMVPNTDSLLSDTDRSNGTSPQYSTAPSATVWKTAADWLARQVKSGEEVSASESADAVSRKPTRIYPKSIYGPFELRPLYYWPSAIGDQPRPFGFWYW